MVSIGTSFYKLRLSIHLRLSERRLIWRLFYHKCHVYFHLSISLCSYLIPINVPLLSTALLAVLCPKIFALVPSTWNVLATNICRAWSLIFFKFLLGCRILNDLYLTLQMFNHWNSLSPFTISFFFSIAFNTFDAVQYITYCPHLSTKRSLSWKQGAFLLLILFPEIF